MSTEAGTGANPAFDAGWRTLAGIAGSALAFRTLSAIVAFVSRVSFPAADRIADGRSVFGSTRAFWDIFARWDAGWYYDIARYGYHYTPGGRNSIGFFPAYPLLMRYVGRMIGSSQADLYFGGILISWTSFVVAMVGLYKLARLDVDAAAARRAVLLATVFPFAYFFGVVYTEALFLAATVWTFYFFRTRSWLAGGLCGALATATRVNGIVMWPALAWLAWRGLAGAKLRDRLLGAAALLIVPAGIGLYSLYIYRVTGHPFEWKTTIELWGYYPGGAPWLSIVRLLHDLISQPVAFLASTPVARFDTLNGLAALAFIVATPFVWIRFGAAYGLFMAANLWLPLSSGLFEGLGRYCSVLFPFFILAGSIKSARFQTSALVFSAVLYTLCMSIFTNIQALY